MKKFILALILTILFITFVAFFADFYTTGKIGGKNNNGQNSSPDTSEVAVAAISEYLPYSKEGYERSVANKKVILLFFTSNWCNQCVMQDSLVRSLFETLRDEGVIGFNIHILDSETTIETNALAKKFDVSKESTFVLLDKDGALNFRYTGDIDKELLKSKILEARNK